MRVFQNLRRAAVALATFGLLLPTSVFGASGEPTGSARVRAQAPIVDIALGAGGELRGRVVDEAGHGQAGLVVHVLQANQEVGTAVTDADGNFTVLRLRGGMYHVATTGGMLTCRAWAPHTAPPAAQTALMLVHSQDVVRGVAGEGFGGRFHSLMRNPWFWGGVAAAAIAIPLALDDDNGS